MKSVIELKLGDLSMRKPALAIAAATMLAAPLAADTDVELSVEELLAPYYAKLAAEMELPVAPEGVSLAHDHTITRLAFGSCNHQDRSQHMWAQITATNPDLFLFIGDNNYGDQNWTGDALLTTLRNAYAKQAETPELASFRAQVPMMVTWDDHDFGFNDAGGSFAHRAWSERIFETFWHSSDEVKSRPGVYESRVFGEDGKVTQIITLDTRFFRTDLRRPGPGEEGPSFGRYLPLDAADAGANMLGDVQWQWLEQELAKPADLRLVVSSIQVITEAHGWEAWALMPAERAKLLETLNARAGGGLVLLSGDRHSGGIYQTEESGDEQIWEITSSSLNFSFGTTEEATEREPDPSRVTDFIAEENFGLIDIDWAARELTLSLRGNQGETRVSRTISW